MLKVGHLLKCLVGLGFFRGLPNLWEKKRLIVKALGLEGLDFQEIQL